MTYPEALRELRSGGSPMRDWRLTQQEIEDAREILDAIVGRDQELKIDAYLRRREGGRR